RHYNNNSHSFRPSIADCIPGPIPRSGSRPPVNFLRSAHRVFVACSCGGVPGGVVNGLVPWLGLSPSDPFGVVPSIERGGISISSSPAANVAPSLLSLPSRIISANVSSFFVVVARFKAFFSFVNGVDL
ncbi:hypothetical protein DFH09DRAFT_438644, partial [Mycena vulgaris]